jgi:uroporphyrin-III C-methyltransferase
VLADTLKQAGVPGTHPVAVVQSASLPGARTLYTTLEDLPRRAAEMPLGGPTLLVLGEVLREALSADERGEPVPVELPAKRTSRA